MPSRDSFHLHGVALSARLLLRPYARPGVSGGPLFSRGFICAGLPTWSLRASAAKRHSLRGSGVKLARHVRFGKASRNRQTFYVYVFLESMVSMGDILFCALFRPWDAHFKVQAQVLHGLHVLLCFFYLVFCRLEAKSQQFGVLFLSCGQA